MRKKRKTLPEKNGVDLDELDIARSDPEPHAHVDLDREPSGAPVVEVDLRGEAPGRPHGLPPGRHHGHPFLPGRRDERSMFNRGLEVRGDTVVFLRREEKA